MHALLDNTQSSDKIVVNSVVSSLCNMLNDSAKRTFGTVTVDSQMLRKRKIVKKWFNDDCRRARKKFHLRKRIICK